MVRLIGTVLILFGTVGIGYDRMRQIKKHYEGLLELKESLNLSTAHAEIIAINKASKKLKTWHLDDCVMYVTLEPCVMCAGAIIQSRIKRVVYGAKSYQDGAIESALKLYDTKGFNHYPETMYYDKNENCSKIITDYFKTKR